MALTQSTAANKDANSAKEKDTMQHRHFAVVAGIIKDMPANQRQAVAEHFASGLRSANSKFNKARFLKACGI